MALLLQSGDAETNTAWLHELSQLSDMPVFVYPDCPNLEAMSYALVWKHPHGDLCRYQNLRAIFSLGAGVNHLTDDPKLPDVPIIRLADPAMARYMASYSLYWVVGFHRRMHDYAKQQKNAHWQPLSQPTTKEYRIGILGYGAIGQEIGAAIASADYTVCAWSNSHKQTDNLQHFYGIEMLHDFLSHIDVLINCLPLTKNTHGLLDNAFFSAMKNGSHLINIGRGATVIVADMLKALNSGKLARVVLDVCHQEPLPRQSPLWNHPNIHITPHISGPTQVRSAAVLVMANIDRIEQGLQPFPLYCPTRGY